MCTEEHWLLAIVSGTDRTWAHGARLTQCKESDMYGTRITLCHELERMFTPDEPLALLVWTEEGIRSACGNLRPDDDEVSCLLEVIGNTRMDEYRRDGMTDASVTDLLMRHRQAVNRQVTVSAEVLSRVVRSFERELVHQEGLAWEAGSGASERLCQSMADVEKLKALLKD